MEVPIGGHSKCKGSDTGIALRSRSMLSVFKRKVGENYSKSGESGPQEEMKGERQETELYGLSVTMWLLPCTLEWGRRVLKR